MQNKKQKIVFPTGKDFWIPRKSNYAPRLKPNAGNGQAELRKEAYKYVESWRGCVDAGANVGMWTRSLMNDFNKVYCFEPNPVFAECWKKNIPSGKNAILHEVGLGKKETTANFDRPLAQKLERRPGRVHIKTLDSYALTDIDFIKIDVDGYEDLLVKGAQETIANNKPVINIEMKWKRPKVVRVAARILKSLGYTKKVRTKSDEVWLPLK